MDPLAFLDPYTAPKSAVPDAAASPPASHAPDDSPSSDPVGDFLRLARPGHHTDLILRTQDKRAEGTNTLREFRRNFMPFGDLTSAEFLGGGKVASTRQADEARRRFEAGEATDEDIDTLATAQYQQETSAAVKRASHTEPFYNRVLLEAGSLGKIVGEMVPAGKALQLGGRGVASLRAGRAASVGVAPEVAGLTPGALSQVPGNAAALARGPVATIARDAAAKMPITALTPSMWVPMMQQNNVANGREANDLKGLPTAYGFGLANMVVLGRLGKGLDAKSVPQAFMKGTAGVLEMNAVEATAGLADRYLLEKAYQVKPTGEHRYGTIGSWLKAYKDNDRDKAVEGLRDTTAQMLTFSAFAAMHGRESQATGLAKLYADSFARMRDGGMSKGEAAARLKGVHELYERRLEQEPFATRGELKDVANLVPHDLRDYARHIADVFVPQQVPSVPTTPQQQTAAQPTALPAAAPPPVVAPPAMTGGASPMRKTLPSTESLAVPAEAPKVEPLAYVLGSGKHTGDVFAETADGTRVALSSLPLGRLSPDGKEIATADRGILATDAVSRIVDGSGKVLWQKPAAPVAILATPPEAKPSTPAETVARLTPELRNVERQLNALGEAAVKARVEQGLSPDARAAKKALGITTLEARHKELVRGIEQARALQAAGAANARKPGEAEADWYARVDKNIATLEGVLAKNRPVEGESKSRKASREATAERVQATLDLVRDIRKSAATIATPETAPRSEVEATDSKAPGVGVEVKTPEAATLPTPEADRPVAGTPGPSGERFHIASYKDPAKSVDWALEMLGRRGHPAKEIDTWTDAENARGQAGEGTVTFVIDSSKWGGPIESRQGIDRLLPSTQPFPYEPGLSRVVYKGRPAGKNYERLALMVNEVNEGRAARGLPPVLIEPRWGSERVSTVGGAGTSRVKKTYGDGATRIQRPGEPKAEPKPDPVATIATPESGAGAKGESLVRDYLESAAHNTPGSVTPESAASLKGSARRAAVEQFGQSYEVALRQNPEIAAELSREIRKLFPDVSETAPAGKFDGAFDSGPAGLFTGDAVRTIHPGLVYKGKAIAKSKVVPVSDTTTRPGGVPPEKSVATIATDKSGPEKSQLQEIWDTFSEAEVEAMDPAARAEFEAAGVDTAHKTKSATKQSGFDLEAFKADVATIAGEQGFGKRSDVSSLVMRHIADGKSYNAIAAATGLSKTTAYRVANTAMKAIAERFPEKYGELKTANDLFKKLTPEEKGDLSARRESLGGRGEALFSGIPVRVGFLDRLFGRGVTPGRSLFSRVLSKITGDLPKEVREAKAREVDGRVGAAVFDVQNAEKDFYAALAKAGTPYESLPPDRIDKLDRVLRSDPAARQGESPEVLAVLDRMRAEVDKLSGTLVAIGAADGPLAATIAENTGVYLNRQYEVFRDPAWESKVSDVVKNQWKAWYIQEYQNANKGATPDSDLVEGRMLELLRDGTAAENPISYIRNSKLGAKDLSIFMARGEVPEPIRALWGEVKNPLANYANSVGKMSQLIANHAFLSRVAAEGRGRFLFDAPTGTHVVKIAEPENAAMKPLVNYYTTPEIKRAFEEQFKAENTGPFLQAYMKAVATAKLSKVVLSHTGQARNFLSNIGVAVRNGWWGAGRLPETWRALRKDTPEARDYWRRMIRLRVVGESVHYNDFQKTVADAFDRHEQANQKGLPEIDTHLAKLLQKGTDVAKKTYHYGDSFWRVYGFENEKASYQKAGFTEAEAEAKAAANVGEISPTYSRIAPGLQKLRRLPFAPFFAFQSEIARTTYANLRLGFREMRDANKEVRAIGAKRLAGTVAAMSLPLAAAAFMRNMIGVTNQEEDAARRMLPEYQKESQLLAVGRDKKGQAEFIDLSRVDPHAYLMDGVMALVRSPDEKGAEAAFKEFVKPFVAEELLARPVMDWQRNRREPGGEVYNEQDTRRGQVATIVTSLAEPFVPGGVSPLRRAAMSLTGEPEAKSGQTYSPGPAIQEQFTGQRVFSVDPERTIEGKARTFDRALSGANRMTLELVKSKGALPPEKLAEATQKTAAARAKLFAEMKKDMDAAETLGVPRTKVLAILRNAGVSQADASALLAGRVPPHLPEPTPGDPEATRRGQEVRRANLSPASATPPPPLPFAPR